MDSTGILVAKMDRHNIVTLPHDRLRHKSTRVNPADPSIGTLVQDMIDASLDWEDHRQHELCVGLAAVQVDQLKRVVVLRADQEDKTNREFTPIINPKIIRATGKPVYDYEGCLSVRNVYGSVPRYPKVKIKAYDLDGREFRLTADGFLARLIQHEIDHLNGLLYVDRIKDEERLYRIDENGEIRKLTDQEYREQAAILW